MSTKSNIRPKPEEEELRQKQMELGDLGKQLIDCELRLVSLKRELADFEKRYIQKVGALYAELDDIEAQIAEFLARQVPKDVKAQNAARDARAQAEESRATVTGIIVRETARSSTSSSLKSLYREVAKRIHPDLAVDQIDHALRQRLMAEANLAYENGDESRLRRILEECEGDPDSIIGDGTGAELVRVIRKIAQVRRRLAEINQELKEINDSEIARLKRKVDKGTEERRDILNEMASGLNSRINERRAALRKMSESKTR